MPVQLADYLLTDDLTILLSLISATLFLIKNLYKPQPLVHPILLGRQSDVGRARNPGESAVYRNYGTGLMGRFPLRPSKEVHILQDFVRLEIETSRTLWSTKLVNGGLQDRAAAFGTGLLRLTRLQPGKANVMLLLNDCIEFVVADLALASHGITSFTLTSSQLLLPVFESQRPSAFVTHAFVLPKILELIYEHGDRKTEYLFVVLGEPSAHAMASVASNVKVLQFADVEQNGIKNEKILSPIPKPSDVFTISFYETASGQVQGAQLTHENLTAGVAAIRALFPLSHTLTSLDTILSAHSLSSLWGRSILYTAIFENTSFATVATSKVYYAEDAAPEKEDAEDIGTKRYPTPSPTIFFIKHTHARSLTSEILKQARGSLLNPIAWRQKLAAISEGFLTNQSLWDRLVFNSARVSVLGHSAPTLRAVVVSGGNLEATLLTPMRVALSVPLVNAHTHPLVAGPVLSSHLLDLQDFSDPSRPDEVAHTGAPSVNVEVKLKGVNDDAVENGADPVGKVHVRGPPVTKALQLDDFVNVQDNEEEEWTSLDISARVQTNGAFVLSS